MKKIFNNLEIPEWVLKTVVDRINEMMKSQTVQEELVKKHKAGMTKKECKEWLINGAVASLFISPEERQR